MNQKILRIDASMRKTGSYSRQLTDQLVNRLNTHQSFHLLHRDLSEGLPFIDEPWIVANFTDENQRSAEQKDILATSDQLVAELKSADILVIALPIYNFGVPAAFKAWVDLVARARLTFRYTDQGPKGLLNDKKAYVVVTSGGTPIGSALDFASGYVQQVLSFIGITDVVIIDSGQLNNNAQATVERAHSQIELAA